MVIQFGHIIKEKMKTSIVGSKLQNQKETSDNLITATPAVAFLDI